MPMKWNLMKSSSEWTLLASYKDPPLMGKTLENKAIRFHVYRSLVKVWDLENAGKRGKKVDHFSVWDIDFIRDDIFRANLFNWIKHLNRMTYDKALAQITQLIKNSGADVGFEKRTDKGVDIAPAGMGPFNMETPEVSISADWGSFSVSDKSDQYNLPACIPAMKGNKKDIKVFYRWVQDSANKLKRLTYHQILKEMDKAGINYHTYCRMD